MSKQGQVADIRTQVVVLGAGPGGYTAAFRAADLGRQVVLIERYPSLGGVCLNVGCIPSKALLHTAEVMNEVAELEQMGVRYTQPKVDLKKMRAGKDKVVGKLTGGLAALAKQRKVQVVTGVGKFSDPKHIEVQTDDGLTRIEFEQCIIACGSAPVKIPGFPNDDPRLIDSTGALALEDIPNKMLIVGGGIIGLEMATVYATLGSKVEYRRIDGRTHSRLRPRFGPASAEAARRHGREHHAQDEGYRYQGPEERIEGFVRRR